MSEIHIKIKPANDKVIEFDIDPETTKVSDLKALIATKLTDADPQKQRLIYSGRILKSDEGNDKNLSEYNVKDGNTIHLVVSKKDPSKPINTSTSASATAGTATGAFATGRASSGGMGAGGFDPMAGLGASFGGGGPGGMNPEMMDQFMSNPMFQQIMQQLLSNPQLLQTMMESHPMFQSMPEEQRRMLLNPDMLRLMTNPEMMRSISQLQASMGRSGQQGGAPPPSSIFPSQQQQQPPGSNQMFDPAVFQNLMASMGGGGAVSGGSPQQLTPEQQRERYSSQLAQLNDMGFFDESQNLRALSATNGNVNAAVEYLLSHPF